MNANRHQILYDIILRYLLLIMMNVSKSTLRAMIDFMNAVYFKAKNIMGKSLKAPNNSIVTLAEAANTLNHQHRMNKRKEINHAHTLYIDNVVSYLKQHLFSQEYIIIVLISGYCLMTFQDKIIKECKPTWVGFFGNIVGLGRLEIRNFSNETRCKLIHREYDQLKMVFNTILGVLVGKPILQVVTRAITKVDPELPNKFRAILGN